jgi:hypothetical protein
MSPPPPLPDNTLSFIVRFLRRHRLQCCILLG